MSQIIKLQEGGKITPKNLQEYNNQKAKLEEERRKKELEASSNSITIDGKTYTRSEAKEKLSKWRGDQSAMDLRQSYGRRGKNVDSDYKRFLDMIDTGDVKSIDFNADGGFDVKYSSQNQGQFNPSDKYSSDYLATAIRNNLLNLSTPDVNVESPEKINLDYNPKDMLLNAIWGNKFRQDTYNEMSEFQKTGDVAKTLKENRNKFAEYFTDKSAFNVGGEVPFKSIEEYDQFINNLESLDDEMYEKDATGNYKLDTNGNKILNKNKSTWSFAEQLRDRKFGDFWADYIFGNKPQTSTSQNTLSPEEIKKQEDEKLRIELGLPKGTPLSLSLGENTYIPTREGLRSSTGDLYTGYLWTEPYGKQNDFYKQGYYNKGIYVGGLREAKSLSNIDPNFRKTFFETMDKANTIYNSLLLDTYNPGATGTDKYNFINKIYPNLIPEGFKGRVEDITKYIEDPELRSSSSIFNIYDESEDSRPGGLYRKAKYSFKLDKNGNLVKGIIGYDDKGFQTFTDEQGNKTIIKSGESKQSYNIDPKQLQNFINTWNRVNNNITNANQFYKQQNLEREEQGVPEIYRRYRLPYPPQKKKNGGILKLQEGGDIYTGSEIAGKSAASMKDFTEGKWENLSAADKADLAALGLDIAGLISTAAVGVGNVVGAGAGLGSTAATITANALRGDMSIGAQIGGGALNLAMDAATLIPGLGTLAKGAKTIRTLKKIAPVLRSAFIGLGLTQAGKAVSKAMSDEEMTIDDWRQLASGLTAITATGRQMYSKNKFTQKTFGEAEPITVSSNKKDYNIAFDENEVKAFNKADKTARLQKLRDKIKTNNPDITEDELNSINLNNRQLLSPKTWKDPSKIKYNRPEVGREFKPEVAENLVNNKYGWFKKGLIEERMYLNPNTPLSKEKYIKTGDDTYGTIESTKNILQRPKLKPEIIKASPKSRQLPPSTGKSEKGTVDYINPNAPDPNVKPRPKPGPNKPYESNNEELGKEYTTRKAAEQAEIKARKEVEDLGIKLQRERFRKKEYQDIVNYNKQQKEAAQKISQQVDNKKAFDKARQQAKKEAKGSKKVSKDKGERIARKGIGGVLKLAYGGLLQFNLSSEPGVNLAYTGEQYVDNTLSNQGRLQKKQVLSGGDTGLNIIPAPKTTYFNPTSELNEFRAVNTNKSTPNYNLPLSTISSITSVISKNRANKKIFDLLNTKLKPTVLDTPQDINYNIQGNEGVRGSFYKQASNLTNLSRLNQTTDADRQLAYNLTIAKAAAEARLQGDLANEQALTQSREKAFQTNANNLLRREQVSNQNRASITDIGNRKAMLEAQKIAQNAQNKDIFLHDITEQLKQRAGERQQIKTQQDILTKQGKDFQTISDENINEATISKKLSELKPESAEYKALYNKLLDIQKSRLNRNLGYQLLQANGALRQVW